MTEGEFPFRSFTMRSEGYDQTEVDAYVSELQNEIVEQRRALEAATATSGGDTRLHDPEGAVTRTLAIAQETADRVLHDAQVEADRRRSEADEHATTVVSDADERAARLLGDMEAQAAEVREQGVAAARSAIQVERDKAMGELAHVRRVRDDLRTEAVDLKASLDQYRSQAREASDTLAAAAVGPLTSLDLPDFIDDDVVLAGISSSDAADDMPDSDHVEASFSDDIDASFLRAVEKAGDSKDESDDELAEVISIDADTSEADLGEDDLGEDDLGEDDLGEDDLGEDDLGEDDLGESESAESDDGFGGTFLAEVRAAADADNVAELPQSEGGDQFLSELRGIADGAPDGLDSDVADRFFDDDR